MLKNINIENILFLDIETVPAQPDYNNLSDTFKELWDKKLKRIAKYQDDATPEQLYNRAGIYAEFGKIICISVGYLKENKFRIKSFFGDDEKILLKNFAELLNNHYNKSNQYLCGHNGKEFDFPYIARRMLVNDIILPNILDTAGKKPWEVSHLDTMELWKFGDYKNYTSLSLLAAIFNIPTPKDDIDGSEVANVYWHDNDLNRIATYCQKDTLTVAQIFLKYQGKPLIKPQDVIIT